MGSTSICQRMKWMMNTVRILLAVFLLLCLATSSEAQQGKNKKQNPGKCVKPCMPRCKPGGLRKSGGNNERTMDGTAERRPTKKKVNLGKTAHCSPLPTPVWPYKQNFPAHLSECLSHT